MKISMRKWVASRLNFKWNFRCNRKKFCNFVLISVTSLTDLLFTFCLQKFVNLSLRKFSICWQTNSMSFHRRQTRRNEGRWFFRMWISKSSQLARSIYHWEFNWSSCACKIVMRIKTKRIKGGTKQCLTIKTINQSMFWQLSISFLSTKDNLWNARWLNVREIWIDGYLCLSSVELATLI